MDMIDRIVRDKGWSVPQIAEALFLSEDAIRNHIQDYLKAHKLKVENGGSNSHLSCEQSALLQEHLET